MAAPKIEPRYMAIGRLFHENFIFRVPKYQRGYAWGDSEVEDFLNDLWKCYASRSAGRQRHHLFGGVVSAEGPSPGSARRLCELIDGQQRIATFVIFVTQLVLVYENLASGKASAANASNLRLAESRATRLREKYLEYEDEVNRQPITVDRFELSTRDQRFFKELVAGSSPTPARDSHQRLKDAFQQIGTRLQSLIAKQSTLVKKLDALQRFEATLDEDCTVIHIVTDSREEAYRLFQVLNDRGISLTEGDLLRARTLELLGAREFKQQQETIESSWDQILVDPPEVIKKFLMWFYASVKGERPVKTSLFDNFLDGFFPQHTKIKLSPADAKRVVSTVRQVQEEIVVFRKLLEGEWPYPHASPIRQWDRDRLNLLIKALEHELCMPLLLAAACKLDHKRFSQIVQLVERFAFRYKNISNQHVNSLARIYHKHAVAIRANSSGYRTSLLKTDLHELQNRKVSDAIFSAALNNELKYSVSTGNKTLRYFLVSAEYYLPWYEGGANGEPKSKDKMRVFDFSSTTIEHVYPLKAGAADKDSALEPLKNDLGNLTFLGPEDNDIVANESFDKKRPLFAKSTVRMNQEIAKLSSWDKAAIAARGKKLTDLALKVFTV